MSTGWEPQLARLLASNSLDAVLKCFIVESVEPSMNIYYPTNLESEYLRHYRAYDQVFGELLPKTLYEKRWERVCADYREDRNDTAIDDWNVYRQILLNSQQRPSALIGSTTGLSQLDEALGGLQGLTFLAGDKGVGKTTLAIAMAVAVLRGDPELSVLFHSLDMSKTRIYDRFLGHIAGMSYRHLLSADIADDKRRLIYAAGESLTREILPRMKVRQQVSLQENGSFVGVVQSDLNALRQHTGAQRVLVVVDSFRKIPIPVDTPPNEDQDLLRLHPLEFFSRNPANAFLVIAEIRKFDGPTREPVLDDLRGVLSLGYAADNVLLMWQPTGQKDSDVVDLKLRIAKGRDGVLRRDVMIAFDHVHYQFTEKPPTANRSRTQPQTRPPDPLAGRTAGKAGT